MNHFLAGDGWFRGLIAVWVVFSLSAATACGSATGLKVGASDSNVERADAGVVGDADVGPVDASRDGQFDWRNTPPLPDTGPPIVIPPLPVDPTCFEVPTEGPIELSVRARAASADVLFLIDRTFSMESEIEEIREQLAGVLIPQLTSLVRSMAMGVAVFDEVPYPPYGSEEGELVTTLAPLSTETDATLEAIAAITVGGGTAADPPEGAVPALHTLFSERAGCAAMGDLCLRRAVVPVVLLFTDAALHNGPGGSLPYRPPPARRDGSDAGPGVDAGPPPPPHPPATYDEMLVPVRRHGARVLGLYSGMPRPDTAQRQLQQLARDTGAVNASGNPIFFDIGERGQRVGEGVASVVGSLFGSAPIAEIQASVAGVPREDVPGDDVDASAWVTAVVPARVVPASGAVLAADAFHNVQPGAVVVFRLELEVPADAAIGVYPIEFVAIDGAGDELDRRIVRLVIPGPGVSCDVDSEAL